MKTISKKMLMLWMLAGFASLTAPASVLAQAGTKVASTPPNLEKLEEGPESGITIVKPEARNKITEKREKGKVNEVQVKSGKSSYTLRGDPAIGNTSKGTQNGDANRGAMWTIKEFGGPKEAKEAEAAAALPPAPPPPAPASSTATKK